MTPSLLALAMVLIAPVGSTGDRVVCRLDFEEALVRPLDMPLAFEQVGESGTGTDFPRFGEMSLTDEDAFAGRFAFRFDLKGRSMAARTLPGAIPVLPRIDYRISMHVRTRDLERAGVRVVAWMQDAGGTVIESSRCISTLLRETPGARWQPLSLLVPGHDRQATELVLELQLVQRDLQDRDRPQNPDTRPSLEDVSGVAVFDEIIIEQWPRLFLADATRIGLHPDPVPDTSPLVHLRVDDAANAVTTWHLSVRDSVGELVHTDTGLVPPTGLDRTIAIPLVRQDWYQVSAWVDEADRVLCRDDLALATIARTRDHRPEPRLRIDLTAGDSSSDQATLATDLLGHLGAGEAIIPAWHATDDFIQTWPRTREHVDELKRMGIESMLAVNWVPPEYRGLGPFDADEAAALLAAHPETLDRLVEAAVVAWGDSASRWRVGREADDPIVVETAIEALRERLTGLVVALDITSNQSPAMRELDLDSPRDRMRHAATALIEAWCSGVTPIAIAAPWKTGSHGMEPTPGYPVLRTLMRVLSGRHDVTVLPSDPGIQARMLKGPGRAPIILAWKSPWTSTPVLPATVTFPLGATSVHCMDVLGNPVPSVPGRNEHLIAVADLPVIIEGFEPQAVRMLASLDVQPPTLEASLRVHDHVLRLENPGTNAMAGHLVAIATEGVAIRPAVIGLDLPPGGTLEMPLEFVVTAPLPEGAMAIQWEARLDTGQRVPMTTWLQVEMPDLSTQWNRRAALDGEDLVIDLQLANHGASPKVLMASMNHVDLDMSEPVRVRVEPGATITRTFRVPGGKRTLAGETIALMLVEHDGPCRLREMMRVPSLATTALVDESPRP